MIPGQSDDDVDRPAEPGFEQRARGLGVAPLHQQHAQVDLGLCPDLGVGGVGLGLQEREAALLLAVPLRQQGAELDAGDRHHVAEPAAAASSSNPIALSRSPPIAYSSPRMSAAKARAAGSAGRCRTALAACPTTAASPRTMASLAISSNSSSSEVATASSQAARAIGTGSAPWPSARASR